MNKNELTKVQAVVYIVATVVLLLGSVLATGKVYGTIIEKIDRQEERARDHERRIRELEEKQWYNQGQQSTNEKGR